MRDVIHPHVVAIMGVCNHEYEFHIVMELVKGDSLNKIIFSKVIKRKYNLTISLQNKIAHQICETIDFLHRHPKRIIHKDIKPGNILIHEQTLNVKICDLGFAEAKKEHTALMHTEGKGNYCPGTITYMAPELLKSNGKATTKTDIWALAITLGEMYTETRLWEYHMNPRVEVYIIHKNKTKPNLSNVPEFLRDLLEMSFDYDPDIRPSAKDFFDAFVPQLIQNYTL